MPTIDVQLLGKSDPPPWTDEIDELVHLGAETKWRIAALDGGMASGRPSVALRLDLPDGRTVIAETSLQALAAVIIAARARHPEVFAGGPLEVPPDE